MARVSEHVFFDGENHHDAHTDLAHWQVVGDMSRLLVYDGDAGIGRFRPCFRRDCFCFTPLYRTGNGTNSITLCEPLAT